MKLHVRMWAALAALFAVFALAACGGDDNEGGGGGETGGGGGGQAAQVDTIEPGKLTVGSDIPYKPFEFGKAPDYEGFDVEIVNEVAKRMKLEPKFEKTPFDTIFRDLAQGKFDAVASAVTITDERKKAVDFSDPYFNADQSIMVKKGSDIKTVEDLEGKVIGAQLGTTGADYAKDKANAKNVRTYDLVDDAFQALASGQVDAVVNDFPVSKFAEREKENLEVVQTIPTGEKYGVAFKKGSSELQQEFNKALAEIKQDGTYTRIYKKWFEQDPPKSILEPGAGGGAAE